MRVLEVILVVIILSGICYGSYTYMTKVDSMVEQYNALEY